ncbi:DUF262 domain-containing protein [Vibrio sp. Vb2704]|uniref:DUF262 domain-containing protein n=1 Tax=Vibrio TaxID=662 RepID=UPI001BD6A71E|nr:MULTISPECIES: DUF262 domain-containing protein [Vibrio]MBS9827335.1 DUF262 domain-containing protein [Vibrio alginolyticus]MDW1622857.1 DUF262 domain-containing protein [Vibrio sp. Vb2704]
MDFVVIRLGKDSVDDIKRIDSYKGSLTESTALIFRCHQVEQAIVDKFANGAVYCFLYLGSDNSKGIPTSWQKGIRALGKIVAIDGRSSFQSEATIHIDLISIFPNSLNSTSFLEATPKLYREFSQYPVIGLQSSRNNAIQYVKGEDKQDTASLINAINTLYPRFRLDLAKNASDLLELIDSEEGELEGYEVESEEMIHSFGWGEEYPLNTVLIRTEQRTVKNVVERITNDRFKLDPDFQRAFVWTSSMQSKLIESCLMRIPLPVFYVAEDEDGRIVVVDGLQRLTTFFRFLKDEFPLRGLGINGKRFSELPIKLQERIEDTQLIFYILDEKAPERAKLDIFDRVNGGSPLTRQQMRNCLYNGEGTKFVKRLSELQVFKKVTGGSFDPKTMRDREVINRFLAFSLFEYRSYKGDMDDFLARALKTLNQLESSELANLENKFVLALENNYHLFSSHSFRKSLFGATKFSARSVINIALFDVFSFALSTVDLDLIDADKLKVKLESLLLDNEFLDAISIGTNSTRKVHMRFSKVMTCLDEFK